MKTPNKPAAGQRRSSLSGRCGSRWPGVPERDRSAAFAHHAMKSSLVALFFSVALLSGCVATGPAVSKSTSGNLEINVSAPQGMEVRAARVHVDGVFICNVSERMPVLYLKRGRHTVRVELEGTKSYEQVIAILGDPNHQVLNI